MTWLKSNRKSDPCLLKPHGIPLRYLSVELDDIRNSTIKLACTNYLRNLDEAAGQGLAPSFFGRGGSYKTVGVSWLARQLYDVTNIQVAFIACMSELSRLGRDRFSSETARLLEYYSSVSFLVMDDFDAVAPGSWEAERMIELADIRYSNLRPTSWTGNLLVSRTDQSAIVNRYGQAFARRVWEGSEGYRAAVQ